MLERGVSLGAEMEVTWRKSCVSMHNDRIIMTKEDTYV